MDTRRFDRLTAAFASDGTRRRLLGAILGTALAPFLAAPAMRKAASKKKKGKKKKKQCPFNRPPCGNQCCLLEEVCVGPNRCRHRCQDAVKDFGESDVDCGRVCNGAPGEGLCRRRRRCDGPEDCRDGFCAEVQPGAGKVCAECDIDDHCRDNFGGGPRCLNHFCFDCAIDADCTGRFLNGFCATFSVAAGVNQDPCPPNQPCLCRECRTNDDCPSSRPHCRVGNSDPRDGLCYQCLEDLDCPEGNLCEDGECVEFCPGLQRDGHQTRGDSCPATCSNGIQDGDETDVDCGGSCPPCDTFRDCLVNGDCRSGCCNGGTCDELGTESSCTFCGDSCGTVDFLISCARCCGICKVFPRAGNPDCDCPT
jgi:hypothetical protein